MQIKVHGKVPFMLFCQDDLSFKPARRYSLMILLAGFKRWVWRKAGVTQLNMFLK